MLRIEGNAPAQAEFQNVKSTLRRMQPAYTAEQIARAKAQGQRLPGASSRDRDRDIDDTPVRAGNVRVSPPSGQYQRATVGNFLRLQVPSNWRRINNNESVTFSPEGAYYRTNSGSTGFTHGVQVGVIPSESHTHREATDELIDGLVQGNPQIRRQTNGYVRESIGGRTALATTLINRSEVTGGAEIVTVSTVPLRDGGLMYVIAVAPQEELDDYATAFRRLKQTVELNDQRTSR
jgi:hypothetical protein